VIASIIWNQSPISRKQIVEITKLNPSTISNILQDFINKDLVNEKDTVGSKRGPKQIMLEMNPEVQYFIGIDFTRKSLRNN